jgi:signal transduction histidine kinase/PAS domain-containing protein
MRTEEVPRESEERLRLIERAARDAAWDWNLVTGEVTWTAAVQSVFGYSPEEIEPTINWWLERVHPLSRDRVGANLFRLVKGGGSEWADEYPFRRRDGSYVLVFNRGCVVRDSSGRAIRMVGAMVDHSRFDVAAEIRKGRGLMHAALEALTPSIAVVDGEGTILATNEAWRRFARENGADPATTGPGANYLEVCRRARGRFVEGAQDVALGLQRILAKELAAFELEYPCPSRSEPRWFLLRATPLQERPGVVIAHIDVTALKCVEWRIRCLEEASHVVGRSLDAQTLLGDLARFSVPRLAAVSAVHLREGGAVRRIALVRSATDNGNGARVIELHAPELHEAPPAVARAMQSGESVRVSDLADVLLPAKGRNVEALQEIATLSIVTAMVVPLHVYGRTSGAVSFGWTEPGAPHAPVDARILEEITERAAIAVDNAVHYEEKERAILARDDILAVVSHDLRNLLNQAILGTGILLKALPTSGPTKKAAEIVGRSTERMRRLVSDLLDFANVEAGRLALEHRPTRVSTLVREAQQALEPLAERSQLTLRVEVVGDGDIICDQGRVLQVLSNLVGNAVKFSQPGTLVTLRAEAKPNETTFSVIDAGPGIEPADLPHVFERYWRGKETAGCGLGLAIAKGIVEGHGGRIWVESQQGAGSAFRFTLPSSPTWARPQTAS